LEDRNYRVTTTPATHNFDAKRLISNWSHRHAGYIAGSGKFGLNNMITTERGCCGKCLVGLPRTFTDPVKNRASSGQGDRVDI
jgi:hypothetical protein